MTSRLLLFLFSYKVVSHSFVTLWTVCSRPGSSVHGISPRQEYWSGLSFPSPGDLPDPGIKPESPALEADTLTSEPPGKQMSFWNSLVFLMIQRMLAI